MFSHLDLSDGQVQLFTTAMSPLHGATKEVLEVLWGQDGACTEPHLRIHVECQHRQASSLASWKSSHPRLCLLGAAQAPPEARAESKPG